MFCYHCQEAKKNVACDTTGICGKQADISSLQDLLVFSLKGLAFYSDRGETLGLVNHQTRRFIAKALYAMVTNVNFTAADFVQLIDEAVRRRDSIARQWASAYRQANDAEFSDPLPEEAAWQAPVLDEQELIAKGEQEGVTKPLDWLDQDVHALQECLTYAVKGLASLAVHNLALGIEDADQYRFMQKALNVTLNKNNNVEQLMTLLLEGGELGLKAMQAFEQHNAEKFGDPEPTKVHLDTWDRPGILISGHDLQDIEDLLEQTAGTGIDVYTHGETISAHTYPRLKKYFNLVGNYGGAWQDQKTEFTKFNGPLLITTDSIQQPKKAYQDKIFTTGMVGWPEVPHIAERKPGQRKDFSAVIELAKSCSAPTPLADGSVTTGYGRRALLQLTEKVAAAIRAGSVKRIVVLAGIDGRHKERRYYTELAEKLPEDTLILTAGDVKYRFNTHAFGDIDADIPRLLDAGQITAFSTLIAFLQELKTHLSVEHINQLPVSFEIAWYEQKTLLIMLALFALGFQNIRIGPTLPPFFTENILQMLDQRYQVKGITTVEEDTTALMAGQ